MQICKACCTSVSFVEDESILGSSADGGKTLEPNSNYSISKGHIHTHVHTQHTRTPQHPCFHSLKHKELHCYCTRLKN